MFCRRRRNSLTGSGAGCRHGADTMPEREKYTNVRATRRTRGDGRVEGKKRKNHFENPEFLVHPTIGKSRACRARVPSRRAPRVDDGRVSV